MRAQRARILLAAVVGAAASIIGITMPAQAAACPRGTGVTVVVNSSVRCDANGGGRASSNFTDTGHSLKYVGNGFVCQVDNYPAECKPPSDDYWSLWWSDGRSGSWVYSGAGVGSLKVPSGGWVAFRFQNNGSKIQPGVRPIGPAPAPAPKPKPAPAKTATANPMPAKPSPTASGGQKASAKPSSTASTPTSGSGATASTPDDSSGEGGQATDDADDSSKAMLWMAGLLGAALLVAVVVIARARSQRP